MSGRILRFAQFGNVGVNLFRHRRICLRQKIHPMGGVEAPPLRSLWCSVRACPEPCGSGLVSNEIALTPQKPRKSGIYASFQQASALQKLIPNQKCCGVRVLRNNRISDGVISIVGNDRLLRYFLSRRHGQGVRDERGKLFLPRQTLFCILPTEYCFSNLKLHFVESFV
jgi:hypothetical protein